MSTTVDELLPLVYADLRALAARYVRDEWRGSDLQPTGLVHEAYLRLCERPEVDWRDRGHFVAFAARTMRQILVDHAREALAAKRGGGCDLVSLSEALGLGDERPPALVALDDALLELAVRDPRQVDIVELHFFGGLTFDEIAIRLEISRPTVYREWSRAREWLHRALAPAGQVSRALLTGSSPPA